MRVLITGAGGFVASHLREALLRVCGSDIELIATAKDAGTHPVYGKTGALDVTDRAAVRAALRSHIPSHVIHLAGIAAPSVANADARMTWQVHLDGALNLADAILAENPNCCLLHVGSALVYGESTKSGVAVDEATLL